MSRKKFSLVRACAVASAAALVLAACSSGGSSAGQKGPHQKVTLTWWTWTANPKSVIANFEKKYPWITIKPPPSYGSGGTFYAKLTTALAAGNGPDVTQVELDHLPQFTQAHDLVNIAQYDGKYKSDYPSWVWSQVTQGTHKLGLASGPIDPLDYRLALYAIMLIVTWEFAGYNMTILLTSLTSVQRQVIEAARIDGCSELAIALRVKFPLIRRTVLFTVILSIIGTLQLFNEPVLLNYIAETSNSLTPNQIIYNTAYQFGNESLAAAQSIVLAVITIVATVAFYGIIRRRSDPLAGTRRYS